MKKNVLISLLLILTACGSAVQTAQTEQEDPVNIGFGRTVDRKNLTTSVSTVSVDTDTQLYRDIYEMIEGKCAGVEVEGNKVRIRGAGSRSGGGDPLFVVNGVPMSNVSSISPYDVKSITVLKDAASCAIYGVQGANGVILIDLK
jgi:TonB-dependent SusC/RagA subfamily outer membrane receptor